ncbi:hypothetical protein ACFOFO_03460 [Undibacterium arcticum]|uniref:Uncharacterized protein n=1 Tax=Undibacterium arcticum TaxID=1762892 RepID=A0ABV7F0A0_9BURK
MAEEIQPRCAKYKQSRESAPALLAGAHFFLGRAALKVIKQVTVQLAMVRRIGCRQQTVGPRTDAK